MLKKIGRLFVIKTRLEAWLVIYAIALGAVERGRHYLETYPGYGGWMLARRAPAWCSSPAPSCSNSVRPPARGDPRRALSGAGPSAGTSWS